MDAKTLLMIEELESLMRLQSDGLDDYEVTQLELRDSLQDRDWPRLEKCLQLLDFKSQGMEHLENRRHDAWQKLRYLVLPETNADVYQVLSRLDPPYRDCIGALHREIKIKTLRLKGLSQGLDTYIKLTTGIIQAVAGEIQPLLKGRLYSRHGQVRQNEAVSLLLNTHM